MNGIPSNALSGDQLDYRRDPKHNYLLSEALQSRYVLATHFVSDCRHIVEIGGSQTPITKFVKRTPESITVIDPQIDPFCADIHNGIPCKVNHIPIAIQGYDLKLD